MSDFGGFNSMLTQLQGQGLAKTAYQSNVHNFQSDMTLSDSNTMEVNMKDGQATTTFSADLQVLCEVSIYWFIQTL